MKTHLISWIFFAVIILVVIGLVIKNWSSISGIFGGKKVKDKASAIAILIQANPNRTESELTKFGDDYLIAWATAVQNKKPIFTLNGKNYDTNKGTAL